MDIFRGLSGPNRGPVLFFSSLLGIFFLRTFLSFQGAGPDAGLDAKDDIFRIYATAWMIFPAGGIAWACLMDRLREKWGIPPDIFFPIFIFLSLVLLLISLHPSQWSSLKGARLFGHFAIFHAAGWILAKMMKNNLGFWERVRGKERIYFWVTPLFACWVLMLPYGWGELLGRIHVYGWIFFVACLCLFRYGVPRQGDSGPAEETRTPILVQASGKIFFYGISFGSIVYLITDPSFSFDPRNLSYYLGPMADFSAGKSFLVNINAVYGVFVFYFLSLFFHWLPLGFTSFIWVGCILTAIQYLFFHFIVRRVLRSEAWAFFALLGFLMINFFSAQNLFPGFYPSTGPLRFGFVYLLAALILVRNRKPSWTRSLLLAEAAAVASAFFWSFEVCFYTVTAYAGLALFESVTFNRSELKIDWSGLGRRLGRILVSIVLLGAYLYFDIYRRAHTGPDWGYYWGFLSVYRKGFMMLPTPGFGTWWIIAGVLYISVFLSLFFFFSDDGKRRPKDLNAAVFITFYGITQFFYFLGRSHTSNLLHISMPSFFLFIYWYFLLRQDRKGTPNGAQRGLPVLAAILFGFLLTQSFQDSVEVLRKRLVPPPVFWEKWVAAAQDRPRNDDFALKADLLMTRYSGRKKSLAYFFGERDLDVSLYTGRTEVYPYNDILQADVFPVARERILAFSPPLKAGDYIYLSRDFSQVRYQYDVLGSPQTVFATLEPELILKLSRSFKLKKIEEKDGIGVFQLGSKDLLPVLGNGEMGHFRSGSKEKGAPVVKDRGRS